MVSEAQRKSVNRYRKARLHQVSIYFTIADYERIKSAADEAGEPFNTFLRKSVDERITRLESSR